MPVGKILQDFLCVIADGRQLDPLLFESWDCALQLDQLSLAEWSPVGRTEKQKNSALWPLQSIESLCPAKLVPGRKGGGFPADCQSDGHQLGRSNANGAAIKSSPDRYAVSRMEGDPLLRLKAVDYSIRIVVQRQLRTGHILNAFGRFRESFICATAAVHNNPGPRPRIGFAVSPVREGGHGKKKHEQK